MINRENWKLVRKYLEYRLDVDQVSPETVNLEETWLAHWLQWADAKPFTYAPKIKNKFPVYLVENNHYSNIYIQKVVRAGKMFFSWLRKHESGYQSAITEGWLDTLKPPRLKPEFKEHEAVTVDEMKRFANTPAVSLRDQRIKAAVAFLFLTGIRIGAFVSLPIKAVNLKTFEIYQWPELGVLTKNSKRATTTFFQVPDCPELLEIVKNWDRFIRGHLSDESMWFAHFSSLDGSLIESPKGTSKHRHQRARKDLKEWCARYDLEYHSPHKFRHGVATYALTMAKTMSELKAISQNLMHSNISTTDSIYAILSLQEMKQSLSNMGNDQEIDLAAKVDNLERLLLSLMK